MCSSMKSIEKVLKNIKVGNNLTITKDNGNMIGIETRYDGSVFKDNYMVDLSYFIKKYPNLVKTINEKTIYYLFYNSKTDLFENVLIDKENSELINESNDPNIDECISKLDNEYKVVNNLVKIKKVS